MPASLDALVLDCMAKSPEARPTIREVAARLHAALVERVSRVLVRFVDYIQKNRRKRA